MRILEKIKNLRENLEGYRRVLILARKPTTKEFNETVRICAIGIVIIGLFGFTFYLISVLIGV